MECIKCGECCRQLDLIDKILISYHTRTLKNLMFSRRCKFLTKKNMCSIHETKPKHCKDWRCGVYYLKGEKGVNHV